MYLIGCFFFPTRLYVPFFMMLWQVKSIKKKLWHSYKLQFWYIILLVLIFLSSPWRWRESSFRKVWPFRALMPSWETVVSYLGQFRVSFSIDRTLYEDLLQVRLFNFNSFFCIVISCMFCKIIFPSKWINR